MKKLTLKTNYPGLKIYCNGCKKEITEPCKKHEASRQFYKARLYFKDGRTSTRILTAATEEQAIKETIAFKEQVNIPIKQKENGPSVIEEISIKDAICKYLNYLQNIDIALHRQKNRDKRHIGNIKTILSFLAEVINSSTSVKNISETKVGEVFYAVANKRKKNGNKITAVTYNHYISAYRSLFEFLIENLELPIKNHFKEVQLRNTRKKVNMLTLKEFFAVLEKIETGSPYMSVSYMRKSGIVFTERKNLFRPWLKHAVMLALYGGGRRREEISVLKWTQIKENEFTKGLIGGIVYYRNLKVERQNHILFEDEQLFVEVPITEQLATLFIELGWESRKGTDQFIIDPTTKNRHTIMELLTKAFTHYYKQIDDHREGITFKSIRKTYITYIRAILVGNAKLVTGHSSDKIIEQHYEDTALMRKKVVDELKFEE